MRDTWRQVPVYKKTFLQVFKQSILRIEPVFGNKDIRYNLLCDIIRKPMNKLNMKSSAKINPTRWQARRTLAHGPSSKCFRSIYSIECTHGKGRELRMTKRERRQEPTSRLCVPV